jgi:hypothetical protein
MDAQNKRMVRWPFILAGCGLVAILAVCGIAAVLGAGGAWLTAKQVDRVFNRVSTQVMTGSDLDRAAASLQSYQAMVIHLQGVVEIRDASGIWTAVPQESLVEAGQVVRTGELSAAQIIFKDGSQASLGPNTELSVDRLDYREAGQRREIELTQTIGESTHTVAQTSNKGSLYAIHTSVGTGEAKGTQFSVSVPSNQAARFNVLEGIVEVTGQDESVMVETGEVTILEVGLPPSEPALFIIEEGIVTQTGETWVVAGQTFTLHPATVVIGNPQVGDIVFVEGRLTADETRLADLILLVRKSPADHFTLTGEVQEIRSTDWTISGQTVIITDTTEIESGIGVGNLVQVYGIIQDNGALLAERIRRISEESGLPFEFEGVIETIGTDIWLISGVEVAVYTDTVTQEGLMAGDVVKVTGRIQEDGTWLAERIVRALDETRAFEITGPIESMDPWKVAGISLEIRSWTEIAEGLQAGDLVRVKGQIQADGTWLAYAIERVEEAPYPSFVLIGTVISIDPWVVNGIPLNVTEDTIIVGNIVPGMLVRVEINLLPDGTWQVVRITPLQDFGHVPICMHIYATVASVEGDQIHLLGWPALSWDAHAGDQNGEDNGEDEDGNDEGEGQDEDHSEIPWEGELTPNSIVQIYLCIDEEGNITIINIIVINPGNPDYQPPLEGEKVIICHKPIHKKGGNTLSISASALPAHLAHGDTLGACQP